MTPAEQAHVDQARTAARETLKEPCSCGHCIPDATLLAFLALSDEEILETLK